MNRGKKKPPPPKKVVKKRKVKKPKIPKEIELDAITLENLEPWTPETNVWDSPPVGEQGFGESDTTETDDEIDEDENESEWEDTLEEVTKKLNGTYSYRFGDESADEEEEEDGIVDTKYYVPELKIHAYKVKPCQISNDEGREVMWKQIRKEYLRSKKELRNLHGSYLRCPEGGNQLPEEFRKVREMNKFVYCPVSHLQCAHFKKVSMKTRPRRRLASNGEAPTFRRPPHLVMKKRFALYGRARNVPLALDCKGCEKYGFAHHRNPDMHYEDYLTAIKYQGSNPETKSVVDGFNDMLAKWKMYGPRPRKKKKEDPKDAQKLPRRRRVNNQISSRLFSDTISTLMKKISIIGATGDTSEISESELSTSKTFKKNNTPQANSKAITDLTKKAKLAEKQKQNITQKKLESLAKLQDLQKEILKKIMKKHTPSTPTSARSTEGSSNSTRLPWASYFSKGKLADSSNTLQPIKSKPIPQSAPCTSRLHDNTSSLVSSTSRLRNSTTSLVNSTSRLRNSTASSKVGGASFRRSDSMIQARRSDPLPSSRLYQGTIASERRKRLTLRKNVHRK